MKEKGHMRVRRRSISCAHLARVVIDRVLEHDAQLLAHLVDDQVHVLLHFAIQAQRRLESDILDSDARLHAKRLGAGAGRGGLVIKLELLNGLEAL